MKIQKVLLISPPLCDMIRTNTPGLKRKQIGYSPPLGLLYLAAYLGKYSPHQVSLLDSVAEELDYNQIREHVEKDSPGIVGITSLSFTHPSALKVAQVVKEVDPNIRVVMGGSHPSIYPEETLLSPCVDYVVVGEGEKLFARLVDRIFNGLSVKKIIKAESYIEDLDALPFPERSLLKLDLYGSVLSLHRTRLTTLITSRGCPYKCSFCDRPSIGKRLRLRSPQNVVDEMEECVKMGVNEFLVYDDTFTVNRERVMNICKEIFRRGLQVLWDVRTRVDTVDFELLRTMKEAGCQSIHLGIESATPRILKILRKNISLEQVEKAVSEAKAAGMQVLAYFIIGNPTETRDEIFNTINYSIRLEPDFAHFSILTPFPATELYQDGLASGIIPKDLWKEFARHPSPQFKPPLWEENLSEKDLVTLYKTAYRKFYFRPAYVRKHLRSVRSVGDVFKLARGAFELAGFL